MTWGRVLFGGKRSRGLGGRVSGVTDGAVPGLMGLYLRLWSAIWHKCKQFLLYKINVLHDLQAFTQDWGSTCRWWCDSSVLILYKHTITPLMVYTTLKLDYYFYRQRLLIDVSGFFSALVWCLMWAFVLRGWGEDPPGVLQEYQPSELLSPFISNVGGSLEVSNSPPWCNLQREIWMREPGEGGRAWAIHQIGCKEWFAH